jgi:hypothetical protein
MRIDAVLRRVCVGLLAVTGLVGCAESESGAGGGNEEGGDPVPTPTFPEGTGQPAATAALYPDGPYGIQTGSVIYNYQFVGFINAAEFREGMQLIALADFYNPTGAEVFPADSRYGANKPKPKALLINVSSVWCGPCNYEAAEVLPGEYAKYKPLGGEFLLQLADGPDPSTPADPADLDRWTRRYRVDYPAAIDPSYKLGKFFSADAYPANMIVSTKDMKIVEVIAGTPDEAFWRKFEGILNE